MHSELTTFRREEWGGGDWGENPCRLWSNLSLSGRSKRGGSAHYSPHRRWMGQSGSEESRAGPLCWQTDPHPESVCVCVCECACVCVNDTVNNSAKYLATCAFFAREQVRRRRLHAGMRGRVKMLMSGLSNHCNLTLTPWRWGRGGRHIWPAEPTITDTENVLKCFWKILMSWPCCIFKRTGVNYCVICAWLALQPASCKMCLHLPADGVEVSQLVHSFAFILIVSAQGFLHWFEHIWILIFTNVRAGMCATQFPDPNALLLYACVCLCFYVTYK